MGVTLTKITRPQLTHIIQRERLFSALDRAIEKPLTWISAPPGSGKTTLVASYVETRGMPVIWYQADVRDKDCATFFHYFNLAAAQVLKEDGRQLPPFSPACGCGIGGFSRTYFETLYALLPIPSTIVIDDIHEVGDDLDIIDVLINGLTIAPAGVSFIVMSRSLPPVQLARLQAGNRLSLQTWKDLQLTASETVDLLALHGEESAVLHSGATHHATNGWAAGVVLCAIRAARFKIVTNADATLEREGIFAYFASEVFLRLDDAVQFFLLKSSFLPQMTDATAARLTGSPHASRILSRLHDHGYFIELHTNDVPVYRYHPLFRDFLLCMARNTLSESDILDLQRTAAAILDENGIIEDTADIYIDICRWDLLLKLIDRHAAELIGQGRSKAVLDWLDAIPATVAEESPVAAYWKGASVISFDPKSAKTSFAAAFERAQGRDETLSLLAWSGVVETIHLEYDDFRQLDPWIAWLESYLAAGNDFPSPTVECTVALAMSWALIRRRNDIDIQRGWIDRATRLAQQSGQSLLMVRAWCIAVYHAVWTGDHQASSMASAELQALLPDYLSLQPGGARALLLTGLRSACMEADGPSALAYATVGLGRSESTGRLTFNQHFHALEVYAHLLDGRSSDAGAALARMAASITNQRRQGYAHYHFLATWHALLDDELQTACSLGELAVRQAEEAGFVWSEILCRLAFARALHETGQDDPAREQLDRAKALNGSTANPMLTFMCHLWEALFACETADNELAVTSLRQAFSLGRRQGYINLLWWWMPHDMSRLCAMALETGVEQEYALNLIRRRGLLPLNWRNQPEAWPWPVKIYTLGRFSIVLNGEPVMFSGKVQQKPLALLKAIIALGGRNVSEELLAEQLWPEADGDIGHQSFATTLHRLRKIIGIDNAIQLNDGKVSLNPLYCWVDVWAFERLANDSSGRKPADKTPATEMVRKAVATLALYNGHFLVSEVNHAWAISMRERLRNKILQTINHAGQLLEELNDYPQAIVFYQKGLACDDLIEEFYQRLMLCHAHNGNRGEVISTFKRCQSVMSALDMTPSPSTHLQYERALKVLP